MKKDTSWGKVADWYDKHLDGDNTYHAQVVLPNLLRVVDLKPDESLLELGCGQGFFVEEFSKISKHVVGVDLGKELIEIAKKNLPAQPGIPNAKFLAGNAEDQKILQGEKFDVIIIVLALQNMKDLGAVVKNMSRLLKENGRVVIVLNHPTFRIPKQSSWGTDTAAKSQYRRVDAYMSELEAKIDMNPGKLLGPVTLSYHRPLQVYSKSFAKEGFAITKIEEWISHRKSEKGPMAKAEDKARKEIPLFMCLVLKRL